MHFRLLTTVALTLIVFSTANATQLDKDNKDNVDIDVCVEPTSDSSDTFCFRAESVNFDFITERAARPQLENFEIRKLYSEETAFLLEWITDGHRFGAVSVDWFRRDTGERFQRVEVTRVGFRAVERMSTTETLPVDVFTLECESDTSEIVFVDGAGDMTSDSPC